MAEIRTGPSYISRRMAQMAGRSRGLRPARSIEGGLARVAFHRDGPVTVLSVRPGGRGTRPPWGGRTRARYWRIGRVHAPERRRAMDRLSRGFFGVGRLGRGIAHWV